MPALRLALTVVVGLLHIPCDALNSLHLLTQQQPEVLTAAADPAVGSSHRLVGPLAPPQTILHFMFLLEDHFPHPRLWADFFAGAQPGTYMVWAHCANHSKCAFDVGGFNLVNARLVPTVSTVQGDHLTPFVHMMGVAMTETAALSAAGIMEKFVVVGDMTLPVKPFSFVHWNLASSSGSDICLSAPSQWAAGSVDGVPVLLPRHHQWVALNRSDAATLVKDWRPVSGLEAWDVPLKGRWAPLGRTVPRADFHDGTTNSATDESAVYALLRGPVELGTRDDEGELARLYLQRRCTTYVGFPAEVGTPKPASALQMDSGQNFDTAAITEQLTQDKRNSLLQTHGSWHPIVIEALSATSWAALRKSPFLFAGKFSDGAPLVSYADGVLQP